MDFPEPPVKLQGALDQVIQLKHYLHFLPKLLTVI